MPEQWRLVNARRRLLGDAESLPERLRPTPEQTQRLRALGASPSLRLRPEQTTQVESILTSWLEPGAKWNRRAAERRLLTLLEELREEHYPATREASRARAERIAEILTPEQIKELGDPTPWLPRYRR